MKISIHKKSIIYAPAAVILLSAALAVTVCTTGKPVPSYILTDVRYGPDRENTMDISLPGGRTEATPVIILIHGGAWTGGDKSDFTFLRGYFYDRGYAVFSANYRLAVTEGTGLKNILQDMESIMSFVQDKSGEWAYSRNVIFLAGHSAGGHIALLYSFTRAPEGTIRGVVSFCGLADLTDPELEMSLARMHENETGPVKKPFDRIGFISGPDRNMRRLYSPQFFISNIPVLLFHGKKDTIIPWRQSENLHKKMIERGFDSTLYLYPDMGHDISPYYGKIMKITEDWIKERIPD